MARRRGLTSTVCFPVGNLCPEGSVIKATAIDPAVVDADGVYRHTGRARVFTTERAAIAAHQGTCRHPGEGRGCRGADGPRTAGVGHGRDVSAHLGAEVCRMGTPRGDRDRCAVLRRQHGSVHRARRARSAGRRTDLPRCATVTDSDRDGSPAIDGTGGHGGNSGPPGVGRRRGAVCWRSAHRIPICGPIPTCPMPRGCGPPCNASEAAPGADACSTSIGSSPPRGPPLKTRRPLKVHAAVVDIPFEHQHDQRRPPGSTSTVPGAWTEDRLAWHRFVSQFQAGPGLQIAFPRIEQIHHESLRDLLSGPSYTSYTPSSCVSRVHKGALTGSLQPLASPRG